MFPHFASAFFIFLVFPISTIIRANPEWPDYVKLASCLFLILNLIYFELHPEDCQWELPSLLGTVRFAGHQKKKKQKQKQKTIHSSLPHLPWGNLSLCLCFSLLWAKLPNIKKPLDKGWTVKLTLPVHQFKNERVSGIAREEFFTVAK